MADDPRDTPLGGILDVTPGDHERFERRLLESMGHPVMVCHGPESDHDCPLLADGSCELVDQAHGIVFKLDLDRPLHREVLAAYRATIPDDVPLAVALQPGQEVHYRDLLGGMYVWSHSPTTAELDGFAALVEASDDTSVDDPPRGPPSNPS